MNHSKGADAQLNLGGADNTFNGKVTNKGTVTVKAESQNNFAGSLINDNLVNAYATVEGTVINNGTYALLYSTPNSLYRAGEHSERFLLDTKLSQRKYAFASDQLTHEFTRILTPKKLAVLMRQSLFTDIRMAYLPTLAKLFVLEKLDTEGITSSNLELAEAEFFYLHLFVNDELRPLIYSDFFQKMGDILYYKNGLPDQPVNNILHAVSLNGYDVRSIKENLISILPSSLKKEEQTTRHQSKHYCLENSKIDKVFEIDSMSNDLSIDSISDSVTRKIRNIYQVSEITDAEVKSILESKKYLFEDPRVVAV